MTFSASSSHFFSRNEKISKICSGNFGKLMIHLNEIEEEWFDDLNLLEDFLSSQESWSPPRLPSRRSKCPKERYISNWAHFQKKTRESEIEFMGIKKFRDSWDLFVQNYPFAFNW